MNYEPRAPRERLKPPSREMSDFFFEQRLYDFTNKKLAPHLTEDMKKFMEENSEAKEKVGAMLLAFEYFNSISEIKLEYNSEEFLNDTKTWAQKLRANIKKIVFSFIFLVILMALLFNLEPLIEYFRPFF